jgi:hypothetical protein
VHGGFRAAINRPRLERGIITRAAAWQAKKTLLVVAAMVAS